jgi:hypothetical protein
MPGSGSVVCCIFELLNLTIDMYHQSPTRVLPCDGEGLQPFFASDARESPINHSASSHPATDPHIVLPYWWILFRER